jgi:hypothetical protein
MACEGFEKRLTGKALADTDPELTAHLATCADCRAEFAAQHALQERITNGIAAMVADEPSPALLTRVRGQIAAEPAPRSANWMQWMITGVTVTAFAVVAMWMVGRPSRRMIGTGTPSVQSVSQAPSASVTPPNQFASPRSVSSQPLVVREHRQVRTASHSHATAIVPAMVKVDQPVATIAANNSRAEIIVPAGQRDAVLRLVHALRTGHVDAASLIRTSQPGDVAPLAIVPLEVKPLNSEGGDGSPTEFENEY